VRKNRFQCSATLGLGLPWPCALGPPDGTWGTFQQAIDPASGFVDGRINIGVRVSGPDSGSFWDIALSYGGVNGVWFSGSEYTTPEPGTFTLFGSGLLVGIAALRRKVRIVSHKRGVYENESLEGLAYVRPLYVARGHPCATSSKQRPLLRMAADPIPTACLATGLAVRRLPSFAG